MIELAWMAAHRATWFPTWWMFQLAAVAVGAIVFARARLLGPFVVGVIVAVPGAISVANGGDWAIWIARGGQGPAPPLEVAGFGALAGWIGGALLASLVAGHEPERVKRALALAFGPMLAAARLGCFFAGCDFGAPTTVPWALRYPHWTPAFATQLDARLIEATSATTLPVHPTQLYEVGLGLLVVAIAHRRRSLALVVALYAAGRFGIDFLRGDQGHGVYGLATSQLLALAALAWAVPRRLAQVLARPHARSWIEPRSTQEIPEKGPGRSGHSRCFIPMHEATPGDPGSVDDGGVLDRSLRGPR